MQSYQQIVTGMNALADQVEAMCSEHEADCHGGALCMTNRMSAVAFLGHRLGLPVSSQTGDEFAIVLADYSENCPHCAAKRAAGDGVDHPQAAE